MPDFTVRSDALVEAAFDNLSQALHRADELAKRHRETLTVWRDNVRVATATPKHTTMEG